MNVDSTVREQQAMHEVSDRLAKAFGAQYPPERVLRTVDTILHRFDDRPIRDFVPVLVERYAREELKASANH